MVLEHIGMPQPGDCRVVFSASAEELEAAIQAEQAAENPPQTEEDLLTAAVNRAILTGFSTLYQELVEKEHLVPVTDPDFELLAVNRAEGFRAGAEFYCLPPLELERYTGFTQPIQPRPIRQVSIELEVNTRHRDEARAADAAGKAALRQQVARELYAQRCAQAKALARRELIFQLGGCVKGTLPKDLVSGNYFAEQRNFNLRLQANNVNFDQYLKVRGQTVEQFRTELHAQAEQKLRGSLGLLMVAEREHLWPTDAEVEAALAHWKGERTFPANDLRKGRPARRRESSWKPTPPCFPRRRNRCWKPSHKKMGDAVCRHLPFWFFRSPRPRTGCYRAWHRSRPAPAGCRGRPAPRCGHPSSQG